jgi:hypothetical protein
MPAIKAQQYRWNKGGAETARKVFWQVLASDFTITNKVHAFFHLFNSSVFLSVLIAAVLSVPMLFIKKDYPNITWIFDIGTMLLFGFLSIAIFYWVATKQFYTAPAKMFFSLFPAFLMISMGLSLHNGLAVLEGLLGVKTPFIRTPKFNIVQKSDPWKSNVYINTRLNVVTIMEGFFCLYFIAGIAIGLYLQISILIFFHVMLAIGFGSVFYFSVKPLTHV